MIIIWTAYRPTGSRPHRQSRRRRRPASSACGSVDGAEAGTDSVYRPQQNFAAVLVSVHARVRVRVRVRVRLSFFQATPKLNMLVFGVGACLNLVWPAVPRPHYHVSHSPSQPHQASPSSRPRPRERGTKRARGQGGGWKRQTLALSFTRGSVRSKRRGSGS